MLLGECNDPDAAPWHAGNLKSASSGIQNVIIESQPGSDALRIEHFFAGGLVIGFGSVSRYLTAIEDPDNANNTLLVADLSETRPQAACIHQQLCCPQ